MSAHYVRTKFDLARVLADLAQAELPMTVNVKKGIKRTDEQNSLVHVWFEEIARHERFGMSFYDVKAHCNLTYGLPILMRDDPEWASCFGYIFEALSKPAKLKAIRVLDIPFTRRMQVKQLSEYMTQMEQDYAEEGVLLTVKSE